MLNYITLLGCYRGTLLTMWYKIQNQYIELRIYAKPNAKRTTFVSISNEEANIALHAKPHQGEANAELLSYLASLLKVPKKDLLLKLGENSRHKVVVLPFSDILLKRLAELEQAYSKV